ncbi:SURF1 family protein [Flexibacterium corallicola]|uniref:SURF1 family protein n=1 Tax=Flexibacterium corallicola TaxID=3037259 RepID=UPI00286EBBCB|nr:SURF1 family protein [Pseudovibrio sp. M1P-2-3]
MHNFLKKILRKSKPGESSSFSETLESETPELEFSEPPKLKPAKPFYLQFMVLNVCVLMALGVLISLGIWQLQRLEEKLQLIEYADTRVKNPAVEAPGPEQWNDLTKGKIDYLPVSVSGRFLLGELFYFDTLTKPKGAYGGQGYFVFSPFATEDGWYLLVNRGFVPLEKKEFSTRLGSAPPKGRITIEGLARRPEIASFVTPTANSKTGEWFAREPRKMADALGLPVELAAPYTLDLQVNINQAGDLPQAGETRVSFSNNHLQYAITWFGLAFALVAIYAAFRFKAWNTAQTENTLSTEENVEDFDERENLLVPPPDLDDEDFRGEDALEDLESGDLRFVEPKKSGKSY